MCGFNPCRETESYLAKIKLGSKGSSFFIPLYGWKDGASHEWYSDRSQTTVIDCDRPMRNGEHPTMKPVELFRYLMENSSKKGDVVFDSFGGSGTTLVAAEETGRVAYLMELDPVYVDVIIKRWQEMTGLEAVRNDGKTYNSLI